VDRFWVSGREKRCFTPAKRAALPSAGGAHSEATHVDLEPLETRLAQLVKVVDDLRIGMYRTVTGLSLFVGVGLMALIGYGIYSTYAHPLTPPELQQYSTVPFRVGDKIYLLGVDVVGWPIPAELIPRLQDLNENPGGKPPEGQTQQPKPSASPHPGSAVPPPTGGPSPGTGQDKGSKDGTHQ
jgi:hypothetical protein